MYNQFKNQNVTTSTAQGFQKWQTLNPGGTIEQFNAQREKALQKASPHGTRIVETFDSICMPLNNTTVEDRRALNAEALKPWF